MSRGVRSCAIVHVCKIKLLDPELLDPVNIARGDFRRAGLSAASSALGTYPESTSGTKGISACLCSSVQLQSRVRQLEL